MPNPWTRRWLWLAAIAMVPVPILVLGPGHVPPLRILMLGAITLSVALLEQATGAVPLLAVLLLFQGAVYTGVAWLLVTALLWGGRRVGLPSPVAPAAVLIVAALLSAAWLPLYRDPYRADASTTNLLHLYE